MVFQHCGSGPRARVADNMRSDAVFACSHVHWLRPVALIVRVPKGQERVPWGARAPPVLLCLEAAGMITDNTVLFFRGFNEPWV